MPLRLERIRSDSQRGAFSLHRHRLANGRLLPLVRNELARVIAPVVERHRAAEEWPAPMRWSGVNVSA